ncbi:S1C family serine protease [Paenibacillus sp. JDR-2]|uniref:S1C family serine protease n=1 Tax=Paenibacillus sp. (strain JDR-2) TaxID=324057 RepID=UPI000166B195|nr:trypsin-like peptidase domain-containing protein [Paenibacillus sp. JDR-2]ACS99477.1 peptidase S1 and S6 chymotrypsin/Hap [Paenibacillus sp. JDR-2]
MKKGTWISLIASVAVLCAGAGTAVYIHAEVPKQLSGLPLLADANAGAPKSLKDIIYATQKLVVMIETEDGTQGSGFVYNDKGDLITNAHVVAGASKVTVKTADARELEGDVIGISTETDVAVVRVAGLAGVEPLSMVRKDKAEIGDEVIAIGSPLGFQNTVTTGIVSGVGRSFEIKPYTYNDLYQISAPIAPGNSGGPLVDKKTGEVLGINSAGIEQSSIGFSIPIVNVLDMAEAWSEHPMKSLPEWKPSEDDSNVKKDASITEYAEYLVTHFYDSLNNADYVYAYSLLGGNWKLGTSYEVFRQGYMMTRNVVIDNIHVTKESNDEAIVTAIISVDERVDGEYRLSKYQVTYDVGYENDQLKLISGKGKVIKQGEEQDKPVKAK